MKKPAPRVQEEVPSHVKLMILRLDQGQCTYEDKKSVRCHVTRRLKVIRVKEDSPGYRAYATLCGKHAKRGSKS